MSEIRLRQLFFVAVAQIFGAGLAMAAPAAAQQALAPGSFEAFAADGLEARVSDFSGLPVPRYSSLRYDRVNGRAGPSRDYPVSWTYERAGLPVVIIRESQDWYKVRDPLGDEVWINRSQLAGRRTAVAMVEGAIRRKPSPAAAAEAMFAPGAVLELAGCDTDWCRVEAGGRRGWAQRELLWGDEDLPGAAP